MVDLAAALALVQTPVGDIGIATLRRLCAEPIGRIMTSQGAIQMATFRLIMSPVGPLTLIANDDALMGALWGHERALQFAASAVAEEERHPVLDNASRQLEEYFETRRTEFDVPLCFSGTAFQRKVWSALLEIPFGATQTYAQIAARVGRPGAQRAVGSASNQNPISIFAPCHRVIGSDGSLTGFAGGLEVKRQLLQLESPQVTFAF